MVNAINGVVLECDIPTKQFLVSLNDSLPPKEQFICLDLDDTRVFIRSKRADFVKAELKQWGDKHTYQAPQGRLGH